MGANRKEGSEKNWNTGLSTAANVVVKFTGGCIFAFLVWYALKYTWYVLPEGREIPVEIEDSVRKNVLSAGLALLFVTVLLFSERKISERAQRLVSGISALAAVLWIGGLSFWWVNSAVRVPNGDCAFVYGGASYFLEGKFSFLEGTGGYCSMYPHQLGLIALTELLFLVVGTYHFQAFQLMCVLFAMGIVFAGYLVLREITVSMSAAVFYSVLISGCLPLAFYTGWVYGDIPSVFFAVMAVWMLLRYQRSRRWGWLAGMVFMVTMAMLNRKNTMIFVVALCLTVLVSMLRKRDFKLFFATFLCILIPWLSYMGIYKMYEIRSGYEHFPGIPTVTWIDMGLHEVDGVCGWYDNSAKELFYAAGQDAELTEILSKQRIAERWQELSDNPSDAVQFFKRKVLSQWNTPLYQSLYFGTMYEEEDIPDPDSLVSKIGKEYYTTVRSFCDRLQFVVYFGMLCYFLIGIRKNSDILQNVTAVTVIGGFLFSIMWEAKARYILPYYIFMFPYAAIGYLQLAQTIIALLGRKSCFLRKGRI